MPIKMPKIQIRNHILRRLKGTPLKRTAILSTALICALGLSACQNVPKKPNTGITNQTHPQAPLDTFRIKGKVSLKQADKGPKSRTRAGKLYTAEIHWEQAGDRYGIDLSGPLNQGHIKIIGDSQLATLWDQQANAHRASSPEQLLTEITGVGFPLEVLIDWISGRPQLPDGLKGVDWETLSDGTRKIRQFTHKGWKVTYREWATWDGIWLPRKMQLEDKNRKLKVFIHAWENISTAEQVASKSWAYSISPAKQSNQQIPN